MAGSFFFYDLETSGINPRTARIMQFAGQRTDMDFNPIGEPVNMLIKLTPDVVPEPDAIMITGITPQVTLQDGVTEAEFLLFFYDEVVKPETIFIGFNSVRFDDEFMRFLHYRNFYDAYEWHWCDGCSRWDMLDVLRMTRALKPEGIKWPFTPEGKPTNRLELLTKLNGLTHEAAHDALSDVLATVLVAKLIKEKQPALFKYMLNCRGKAAVKESLKHPDKIFTYTSGRYPTDTLHTTAAVVLGEDTHGASALVYDLRHDPSRYLDMTVDEIVSAWEYNPDRKERFPVKTLKYNHCPAVVPGFPKDTETQKRLGLDGDTATKHLQILKPRRTEFTQKVRAALEKLDATREQRYKQAGVPMVDEQLYDGFFGRDDKSSMQAVRTSDPDKLSGLQHGIRDKRLQALLPLYKARNFLQYLSGEEREEWEAFCRARVIGERPQQGPLAKYFKRLQELATGSLSAEQEYLLAELQLYGESIVPADVND